MTKIVSSSISYISKRNTSKPSKTPRSKEIINCIIGIFATIIVLLIIFYVAYIIIAAINARRKKKKNKVGIENTISNSSDSFLIDQSFSSQSSSSSIKCTCTCNPSCKYCNGKKRSHKHHQNIMPPPRIQSAQSYQTSFVYLQNNYRPQLYYPSHSTAPAYQIQKSIHNYSLHYFKQDKRSNSHTLILSPNNNSLNVNTNPNRINSC